MWLKSGYDANQQVRGQHVKFGEIIKLLYKPKLVTNKCEIPNELGIKRHTIYTYRL